MCYNVVSGERKEVAVMRTMKETRAMQRAMRRLASPGKHETMLRRAVNHNVHMLTPHGKIVAGRKGRKG